ncbi:hypothetical protein GOBAR_DD09844 [Gossypium barbadense]|nr:hypothetical protein GOBAR_DD09844 [Gossypium barbadense]
MDMGHGEKLLVQLISVPSNLNKDKHKTVCVVERQISKVVKGNENKIRDVGNEQHDKPPNIAASRLLNDNKDLEVAMQGLVHSFEQVPNGAYKENDDPSKEEVIDTKSDCRDKVSC